MRGKQKFRSLAYALIALSRMRNMVNIWQCRKRQMLLIKTAHSMSSNGLQPSTLPVPPKKLLSNNSNSSINGNGCLGIGNSSKTLSPASSSPSQSSPTNSPIHFSKSQQRHHHSSIEEINVTMKDYLDRIHAVHETLGLHTNKL